MSSYADYIKQEHCGTCEPGSPPEGRTPESICRHGQRTFEGKQRFEMNIADARFFRKNTMNIVEPYARIISMPDGLRDGINILRQVEAYGRVSHRSEEAQSAESWDRFIRSVVLNHGDWSITEHCIVVVEAVVDRGITHEWVRHRLGSYTQESTRFVNYEKKMPPTFIMPPNLNFEQESMWREVITRCEVGYKGLLASGCAPQIARSVFPNALASKIIVTYNLRSWRHFFIMRTSKEAHPQMKQVTIPLLAQFKEFIPILFEDIEPERRQAEAMRSTR